MENQATMSDFDSILASRGVTRRSFMKLCAGIAAAAGLSQLAVPRVAQALEESVIGATSGNLYPVIWIEGASCTGCTESFAQVETPDVASVVLDMISLNYSETLSAAAGHSMEEAKAPDHRGRQLHSHLRGRRARGLRRQRSARGRRDRHHGPCGGCRVGQRRCGGRLRAVNGGWMAAAPQPRPQALASSST